MRLKKILHFKYSYYIYFLPFHAQLTPEVFKQPHHNRISLIRLEHYKTDIASLVQKLWQSKAKRERVGFLLMGGDSTGINVTTLSCF